MSDSLRPHGLQPTQSPPSMGFSRQKYWSGMPLPSPKSKQRERERQKEKKRQSQRHRGQKIAMEKEAGEGYSDGGENSTQRERAARARGIPPIPQVWGQGEASAAPQLELANWTPGRRQESLHLEALRVPPGGGCGEGVRHEPRLEKESSRILQRLSWQWAGKLHRLDSLVWDFSVGREDRGPTPSIPSFRITTEQMGFTQ